MKPLLPFLATVQTVHTLVRIIFSTWKVVRGLREELDCKFLRTLKNIFVSIHTMYGCVHIYDDCIAFEVQCY